MDSEDDHMPAMNDNPKIRALIFDFDGLILDTEVPAFEAWREIYEEFGGSLRLETWALVLGGSGLEVDHIAELERTSGRVLDGEAIRTRRLARKVALIEAREAMPGVVEYIADAQRLGLKLAVVSSSSHTWVDGYLAKLGIADRFPVVVCADDAPRAKPYPDLWLSLRLLIQTSRSVDVWRQARSIKRLERIPHLGDMWLTCG